MEALEALFRWMHVFAGITWIGHLYFFNWVNGPLQAKLDGPTKKLVVPELMPRALYWFRWGAAYTWITGALFGTTMAVNVWFRIWPGQQKIIRAVKDGVAPDAAIVKLAGLRSRHNTYMSVPLVWAMIGQHTTYFAGGNLGIPNDYYWVFWLIVIIIGWHIVFQCYKKAGKVQGF